MILSICDYSGVWSGAFRELGHTTIQVDPKLETTIRGKQITYGCTAREFISRYLEFYANRIVGILLAPPCTDFARSGGAHFKAKDADGRTARSLTLIDDCLSIVVVCGNIKFWCLENPLGRLPKLRKLGLYYAFHPHEFAALADDPEWEAYTKLTCLWGDFKYPEKKPKLNLTPTDKYGYGAILKRLGKDTEETKELRSKTPQGFSRTFALAQLERLALHPHELPWIARPQLKLGGNHADIN